MINKNYPDKKWWRSETKYYKFNPKLVRDRNQDIFHNATKFRIVTIDTPGTSKYYILEGYVQKDVTPGEWKIIKGTDVMYSHDKCHWYRNCENAYNRCKKLARKFPEIKMNKLIYESGLASMMYGSTGYKTINIKDL